MTGLHRRRARAIPLSAITHRLASPTSGTPSSYATADPYTFTGAAGGGAGDGAGHPDEGTAARTGPIHGVDRQGRITRVR